jgi:DNA-binding transcriptional LysR family regulator
MDTLLNELRVGPLDLIVGTLPPQGSATDLEERPLFDDATALIVRCNHPLLLQAMPDWEQLAKLPWVLPPTESLLRRPLMAAFEAHGVVPPNDFIETLSLNTILHYVQLTSAIASMPMTLARKYETYGAVAVLPVLLPRLVRSVGVVWPRGRGWFSGCDVLLSCLEEAAGELTGAGDLERVID